PSAPGARREHNPTWCQASNLNLVPGVKSEARLQVVTSGTRLDHVHAWHLVGLCSRLALSPESLSLMTNLASEIRQVFGRKRGPQGVQDGGQIDEFLHDGALHRRKMPGRRGG